MSATNFYKQAETRPSPLGKQVEYPGDYDPDLLCPIARQPARDAIGIASSALSLPFSGADLWTAYELSWLNPRGKPQIALATFAFPADSSHLIESKSFKLYLGAFAHTKIASAQALTHIIARDLTARCGAPVTMQLIQTHQFSAQRFAELDGYLLDTLDLDIQDYKVAEHWLSANFNAASIEETLVSHLLKSNCPVTGQPDWGSVQIRYTGAPIDHAGLLRYIVSYRLHSGFHEQCIERLFMDILRRCRPEKLAVYARYTRRGGLDINPFRTNFPAPLPDNIRTVRQ